MVTGSQVVCSGIDFFMCTREQAVTLHFCNLFQMRSLPVRVSATRVTSFKEQLKQAHIALNKKVMKIPPVFTFSKPLPTPLLTWTFRREWRRLPQFASVEVSTESSVASTSVTSSLQSPPTSSHRFKPGHLPLKTMHCRCEVFCFTQCVVKDFCLIAMSVVSKS